MDSKPLIYYWLILYKRKWDILLIPPIAMISAFFLSLWMDPIYESETIFYGRNAAHTVSHLQQISAVKLGEEAVLPVPIEEAHAPYIGLLKSVRINKDVLHDIPSKTMPELIRNVDFELNNEYMIRLVARDKDPNISAQIANAYTRNLNQILQEMTKESWQKELQLIAEKKDWAEQNIKKAVDALRTFEESNEIASINFELEYLTELKTNLLSQMENSRVKLEESLRNKTSLTEALRKEGLHLTPDEILRDNIVAQGLKKELFDLSAKLSSASVELGESHVEIKTMRAKFEEISRILKNEVDKQTHAEIKPHGTFIEKLRQDLILATLEEQRLQGSLAGFTAAVARASQRLQKYPGIKPEWDRLNEQIAVNRTIFKELETNYQDMAMQQIRDIQYIIVLDTAYPPKYPSFPIPILNTVVALLVGLIGSIGYAFFADYAERTKRQHTLEIIRTLLADQT